MRIQFEFSDDAVKELDALKSKLNAKHRGVVINHAVGVLKWLVKEQTAKNKIIVKRKDGSNAEVIFPELENLLFDDEEKVEIDEHGNIVSIQTRLRSVP